jgi:hypothetical protein
MINRNCFLIWLIFSLLSFNNLNAQKKAKVNYSNFFKKEWTQERPNDNAIKKSNEVLSNGQSTLRFEINKDDIVVHKGKRAEIAGKVERLDGQEKWYKLRVYLPKEYVVDPSAEIVAQWYAIPYLPKGKTWGPPPISLRIDGGHWKIAVVDSKDPTAPRKMIDLGDYATGIWTEWVFHVKFSSNDDGLLEIWKSGVKALTKTGQNYFEDKRGSYLKLGIYKPDWLMGKSKSKISKRVLYYGDVKVGNNQAAIGSQLK